MQHSIEIIDEANDAQGIKYTSTVNVNRQILFK